MIIQLTYLKKRLDSFFPPKIHLFLFKLNLGLPNTYRGTIVYFIDVGSTSKIISESDFIPIIYEGLFTPLPHIDLKPS